MKKLLHIIACASFFYTSQASAVFCVAQEYIHPTTGNSVWLFGDIHCDVDQMMTMARLQQHTLLEQAEKQSATIIAENIDYRFYNPYQWVLPFAIDIALFYKALKDRAYGYFIAGVLTTTFHSTNWCREQSKTRKPTTNLTDHIAQLKKDSTFTTLPSYLASPLFSLVQEAQKRGISAIDVEFRHYLMIVSAYNLPYCINRALTGNAMRYPLTLSDYYRINDAIVAEIENYDAKPESELKDFYKKCINDSNSSYITIALHNLTKKSPTLDLDAIIPSLIEQTGKNKSTVLHDFAEHNMTLLDARLLHTILNYKHKNVFVCAGAYHIYAIVKILEQLGYKTKSVHGQDNLKTLQARGAIGRTFVHLDDLDYFAIDLDKVFAQ